MAEKRNLEGELTKAISHSLDFHKIVVMAIAIAVATIALHFFGWVGSKIGGKYVQIFQYIISGIGWLVGAVAVLCAMVAVCKMSAAKDAGEKKSFIAGIGYAVSSILTVIFANLRYLIWLALGIIVLWLLGYLGLIPKAGPVIWGIIGFIAVLIGLYLAFFVIVKFFLGTLILPGIIAQGGKAIQCFKESKRIMNGHTITLIKRFLSVGLVIVIFVFVTLQAWQFVANKTADTMADNTREALSGGPPMRVPPIVPAYQFLPIIGDAGNVGKDLLGGTKGAGAWIFGIEMIIILLVLQSIPAIFYAVAGMYTYQSLKGEAEMPISSPAVPVDFSKLKGSFDAMGAKFREQMKEEDEPKKKTTHKSGGDD